MFKIIIALLLMTTPAFAVTQFTTQIPTSTGESASNFPAENVANLSILQTLLQNYRQGYLLTYNSSTTLTIGAGEVSVWNGSASLFLQNASTQNATTANLDTGASFSTSTTYYVYAGTSSTTAATATISISLNNTTPSNLTYYKQLGNFTTDSSGNIGEIIDNSVVTKVGTRISRSFGTPYQAATDGSVNAYSSCHSDGSITLMTDSNPSPVFQLDANGGGLSQDGGTAIVRVSGDIKKGDYYQVNTNCSGNSFYFTPKGP